MSDHPVQDAFVDLMLAAFKDAALNNELTQLEAVFQHEGKQHKIRMVVCPEKANPWESVQGGTVEMSVRVLSGKLTQALLPSGKGRIIVVPEQMKWTWPKMAPAGTPQS